MAFWETFTWIDWILVLLIALFLIMIIRNVYKLMKRRNEYMSLKEAQEQYAQEHNERVQSKAHAVDAEFEDEDDE
ncbi:hypothetical protein [Methanimicrococcus blatticola]|uniref:Uncharacterized protein n=1 Tax=Methanimicrococcus blatticola TaxID=91560 RepID=A0A484F4B0_9EURY|nr:hypothetical protein [Methanimicrococcus blatticola]MBZ3935535.1 hypothetical protein [Methanimicrococcus blatticola]MCC2509178.1 hypothetical protein [Methanimicrococcus blatticola]TDQ69456.1 hypothetical protein C7391_0784 [Methanimicrococcus blatticola]